MASISSTHLEEGQTPWNFLAPALLAIARLVEQAGLFDEGTIGVDTGSIISSTPVG